MPKQTKQLLLTSLLLFFCTITFAQAEYIGAKKQSIDSAMSVNKSTLISNNTTTDTKLPLSTYKFSTGPTVLFYYDGNDICYMCATINRRSELEHFVDELRKRYTEKGENLFARNDNKMQAKILIQASIFAVKYTKL
jgi:hypothetical protein